MEKFTKKVAETIIKKYDTHIKELETIHNENQKFVETANQDSENPEIIMWSVWAKEILSQLEWLKAHREYWNQKYLSE